MDKFPELEPHRERIVQAVGQNKTPAEIYAMLRVDGVNTRFSHIEAFCKSLELQPSASAPPNQPIGLLPVPQLTDFPELDHLRDNLLYRILQGFKAEDIFFTPGGQSLNTTLERVRAYCNALVACYFPVDGPVNPEHFKIYPTDFSWPLNMPIWSIEKGKKTETWTLDDVCQGNLIFGATGSGKTTGSGMTLAQSFLTQQFGGLVLTTKPGEAKEWTLLCKDMGREGDVKWLRYDGHLKLNLLAYETQRPGAGAQMTENIVGFFHALLSTMSNRHGQRGEAGFWESSGQQLLRNLCDVFLLAKAPLTLDVFAEFIINAPSKELNDPESWQTLPVFGEILKAAEAGISHTGDKRIFNKLKGYWLVEYPKLAPETRSCVTFGFSAMIDALRSRHIYELICGETTVSPEAIFNGAILILDLPVKEFGDAGVLVQTAIKYLFQRAVERRQDLGDATRPVFLWEDEAQHFFSEYDPVFQQTARSSRVARVMLSQNLNNFYSHLGGGDRAKHLFDSLAGNLNTRIFHTNGDMLTNEWASKMFGTWERTTTSTSRNFHPGTGFLTPGQVTEGYSQSKVREPIVFPEQFSQLRGAGERNYWLPEAYVYRVGSTFESTGLPIIKTAFTQRRYVEVPKKEKGD